MMRGRREQRPRRAPILPLVAAAVVIAGVLLALRGGAVREELPPQPPENPDWIVQQLLPVNEYSRPGTPLETLDGIVVHYVGNPGTTAAQNHSYFSGLADSGQAYASSHFLVGLEGEVLQNIPLDEVAYATSQANSHTLSIEVCHPDDTGEFTPESYASLLRLVNWLRAAYHLDIDQVIRHYDVTGKECPRYFVLQPQAWEEFLADLEAGEE